MRNSVANTVFEYCKKNRDGFLFTGDAGFGVWDNFQKELPDQYLNPGINEQATIGMAAGMSLSHHKVFVYNIIPFVLYRCYEQVRNDVCYQNLPIVLLGIGSGITYAPAGMTHYAVEDIAIAKTMPNLTIFSPSDSVQAKKAVEYAIKATNPVYIRIAKAGEPVLFGEDIDVCRLNYLSYDAEIAILFHGSISDEVIIAADLLEKEGIKVALISSPRLDLGDIAEYEALFERYKKVFVVEEHFEIGGLGSALQEVGLNPVKIAIKNHYLHDVGNAKFLRKLYGIDSSGIANKVLDKLCITKVK
jgi:transketolase